MQSDTCTDLPLPMKHMYSQDFFDPSKLELFSPANPLCAPPSCSASASAPTADHSLSFWPSLSALSDPVDTGIDLGNDQDNETDVDVVNSPPRSAPTSSTNCQSSSSSPSPPTACPQTSGSLNSVHLPTPIQAPHPHPHSAPQAPLNMTPAQLSTLRSIFESPSSQPTAPASTSPPSPPSSPSAKSSKPTAEEDKLIRTIHRKVGGASKLSTYDEPSRVRRIVIEALAAEQGSVVEANRVRRGQLSASERRVVRTVTNRGAAVRSRMRQRREMATLKMQVRAREGRVRQLENVVRALCTAYKVPLPALAAGNEKRQTQGSDIKNGQVREQDLVKTLFVEDDRVSRDVAEATARTATAARQVQELKGMHQNGNPRQQHHQHQHQQPQAVSEIASAEDDLATVLDIETTPTPNTSSQWMNHE